VANDGTRDLESDRCPDLPVYHITACACRWQKYDCRNRLPPWWERAHRGAAEKCIAMRQAKTANDVLVMVVLRRKILAGRVFIVIKFCDCGYVSGSTTCCFGPSTPISFSYRCPLPSQMRQGPEPRDPLFIVLTWPAQKIQRSHEVSIKGLALLGMVAVRNSCICFLVLDKYM
jgi:hypothetical protein